MTHRPNKRDPQATRDHSGDGPSWALMLFLIFFAILVASGIAWAFTHRFFEPR